MSASPEGPAKGSPKGRRIAEKPAKERRAAKPPKPPKAAKTPKSPKEPRERAAVERTGPRVSPRVVGILGVVVLVAGLVALSCAVAGVGPHWIDGAGAIAVSTVLSAALAHRTGGRPFVALLLALGIGLAAVIIGGQTLQTGAAVLTVVVGGVYAVMATVPAVSFWEAAREVLIATLFSGFAALAAVGFEPTVVEPRFDYASLLLALGLVFAVVYRLGAGIHGLGRRGLIVVLVGVVVLVLTLAYGELLRRYGAGSVVSSVLDFAAWTADRIGAFPRPLVVFLGIPALLWGCFQRARRRQGWWVCAFGVTATVPLAQGLLEPDGSFLEAGLRCVYSLVLGLLIGYLLVRLDLAFTAPRGRRGRRAEEADAHRPEPSRFAEL
ncbi:MAG: hypothetical protein ABIR39_21950 [Nocardioides sp.]|uniref:hypothetical protein n=1 Tax=Nocardioides sp. TaxID=35761 RepID=UPI003265B0A8